jgi:hypothetical protein
VAALPQLLELPHFPEGTMSQERLDAAERSDKGPGDESAGLEARFELTLDDVVTLWMHAHTHSPALRQQRYKGILLVVMFLFAFMLILRELFGAWFGEKPSLYWMLFLGLIWTLVLVAGSRRRLRKQIQTLVGKGEFDTLLGPAALRVDERGVHFENQYESHRMSWLGILKIEKTEEYFYFFLSEWNAYIVPRRCFAGPAEAEQFHEYARRRCPGRSRCRKCGYALRGNTTGICPECGTSGN